MIDLTIPLIGPAAGVLATLRALVKQANAKGLAILAEGNPGGGKSHMLDLLAVELTGSRFAIETVNGQSLNVEVVRAWRIGTVYGNLFSAWTIKRIDELDQASAGAQSELLTYLDYLPARAGVFATTNEYAKLRAASRGRLESRFVRVSVASPSIDEATRFLHKRFKVPADVARAIARGAVPEGKLEIEGVNMRTCMKDVQGYLAARRAA
jgi:ATPase family associated with various cellular activities (AAA)